ncbi:MAG: neuraminidase-like domain-containing protein [Minicystis sp.]
MTYFFTARAQHEQYGYYIRRLDADMDRLSRNDALHALSWGDWQKASVPISAQYAYGVVPAFAWNRLFLLWFELEKVTRVDAAGKPVDSYHLRPKYSRQNLDGTFTEAQSVTQPGFDLDVTDDIPLKTVNASRASESEALAPELYEGPFLYQPCYMPGTDSLLVWFKVPGRSASVPARAYSWTVKPNASTVQRETTIDASIAPHRLDDYTSVPHALLLVREESLWLQPTNHTVPIYFTASQGTAWMQIGSRGFSDLKATLKLQPEQDGTVQVTVPGQSIQIQGASGYVGAAMFGVAAVPASYSLNAIRLEVRAPSGETQSVALYEGPAAFGDTFRISLPERTLQVKVPAGVDHGKISMQFVFECHEAAFGSQTLFFRQPFETDYSSQDKYVSHLYYGKDEGARPGEYYLLTEVAGRGALVFALGSNAMREVTLDAGALFDMFSLLRRENQRRPEIGMGEFLDQAAHRYSTILAPEPRSVLDFYGPFGLYAWELFYHIPSLVAATYRKIGKFDVAREWLNAIYDPSAELEHVWRCEPLQPVEGRSLSIADPDRLATENPDHYRLATVRQYLRTMTEQGDAYYRQETAETLRLSRMWYVSALRLFTEKMGDALDQATRSEWTNPTLGSVNIDFRPPYNEDLRNDYTTIERHLDNLRNWRSFDGEPLQIALLAPKLNPRELQLAALSGLSATAAGGKGAQMLLPFTFPEALSKAKEAVRNLMYFGDLLTKGLHRQDEQDLAEMQAKLAHHVAANFERDGQKSLIESMELEIEVLEKSKEEAEKSLEWYEKFAGERFNASEIAAFPLWGVQAASLFVASAWCGLETASDLVPNIYGLSVGGQKYGAVAEWWRDCFEKGSDISGTMADTQVFNGGAVRRQQENEMERDVGELAVERIDKEIERLRHDLKEEKGTLEVLEEKARRTEAIVDFHARRATNKDFHNWYVGRMTSLYNAAFDMALRFCRMAERAYQVDDPKARFINPVWDAQYKGLLSGQGLMLNLQRMDYAYMHRQSATNQGKLRVSLAALDPQAILALRRTGQAMFSLREDLFDEQFPDEHERRIKSVRLRLVGLEDRDDIAARLALIGDRVHRDRRRSPEHAQTHVLGRQQITVTSAETDTSRLAVPEGRLMPFERCGVESTWLLSIPGAVQAIQAKHKTFRQQELLKQLADVTLEITYTARV